MDCLLPYVQSICNVKSGSAVPSVLDDSNFEPNPNIRHEKGRGQKLYETAKNIIPGGTQLLSKRPEMILPDQWPAYYTSAKGIEITTLDGVVVKDFSIMSVGACILGYADPDVNAAVCQCIRSGNISTLNNPTEVELTQLLLELHPWAGSCRYSRNAGDACTIAIRIARAASGKDNVAFCGYHGWSDWYLSANHNTAEDGTDGTDSLGSHLIGGLSTAGVPKALKNTAFPFQYNQFDELVAIHKKHNVGVIIMEPERSTPPKDNFLQKVRDYATKNNIVLIFDEVSSGFRLHVGGLHMKYKVYPDIATFGKGMSNGYCLGAVIGKKEVMEAAQKTFISSTYYTEGIGYAAALACIKKMQRVNLPLHIETIGNYFKSEVTKIAAETGVEISFAGLPCFPAFSFKGPHANKIRTYYSQSMLDRNILGKTALYVCYSHTKEEVDWYLKRVRDVFFEIKALLDKNALESALKGPEAHCGFQRLA